PAWVLPIALLRRANYRMLLNDPSAPDDARRVLADSKMREWHKRARQQLADVETRRKTDEGVIYAALIPGNRLVAEDRWEDARAMYERVGASYPGDWQVRYRLAYLEFSRREYAEAAMGMKAIVTTTSRIPNWLRAAAMLNLAWTHDLAGRRAEALKLYQRIVDDYEDEGPAGAARVGLIAPYRGPIKIR
ncbi:MAG: tetratricopeptide repeat protein, partial [Vicinamibacterales bacterium]